MINHFFQDHQMTPERILFFERVLPDRSPRDYIDGFVKSSHREASVQLQEQMVEEAYRTYLALSSNPFRLSAEEDLRASLPEAKVAELRIHQRKLKAQMRGWCFLPEEENVVRDGVTVLAEAHGFLAAGTVVYRRETNHAVVLCALPYSVLNTVTAEFTHTLTMPPLESGRWAMPLAVRSASSESPLVELIDDAFTIGSTLVWALPSPYGPIGAGVIALAEILFGKFAHDGPSPIIDAIKGAVSTLQFYIDQKVIA